MYLDFPETIQALPPEGLLGRAPLIEHLFARITQAPAEVPPLLAVSGPPGIGKSGLLRGLAARLLDPEIAMMPLYFDFSPYGRFRTPAPPPREEDLWAELHQSLVRQIVAYAKELPLLAPPLCGAGPRELAEFAYTAGLGDWIARLTQPSASPRAAEQTWRGLLHNRAAGKGPRPVLFFDGLSLVGFDSPVGAVLRGAVRAAAAESIPMLVEDAHGVFQAWPETRSAERLELPGLDRQHASALIEMTEPPAGDASAAGGADRVFRRLGGNPALIRQWTEAWGRFPDIPNRVRRAETAYLQVISRGLTALRWRACLERVIPAGIRTTILRTLASFSEAGGREKFRTFSIEEFQLRVSLSRESAEAALQALEYEGFIRRSGESYAVATGDAFRDWIAYHAACSEGGAEESGRPRTEFLRGLLGRPPSGAEDEAPAWIAALLEGFCLQNVPQPLFHFGQYFEALGDIPPERRVEEVMRTSAMLRLPEIIGVVRDGSAASGSGSGPELLYARGYRNGVYRRSNEETWIIGDFTQLPTLTTLEIEQFSAAAAELERRLGPGHFTRWILAGDSVSPVAIELLTRSGVYCSAAEQIKTLRSLIHQAGSKGGRTPIETRAGLAPFVQTPQAPARRVPVIPVAGIDGEELTKTVTRLNLLAEQQNEVIAASTAERIAQQAGFDPESIGQIKMAVLEGCLNAIEHSLNAEKEIRLSFFQRPDELEIAIENEGEVFDPLEVADPDPAAKLLDKNKRGWGIKLMKQFMDEVRYEPARGGMCLRLIKKKKATHAERKPSGARKG